MQSLSGFFDKFRNRAVSEMLLREKLVQVIRKQTGIELKVEDMNISSGVLTLKISSLMKNEIFIKKQRILKDIHESVSEKTIVDIK